MVAGTASFLLTDRPITTSDIGRIARVRHRQYLVDEVRPCDGGRATIVGLSCIDPDNLGRPLEVIWQKELSQKLLGRFLSQGFMYSDLSRACLAQTNGSLPRVYLIGRLCLFGHQATRLHEDVIAVFAERIAAGARKGALRPVDPKQLREEEHMRRLDDQDKRIRKTLEYRELEMAAAQSRARERAGKAGPVLFDTEDDAKPLYDERARKERASEKRDMLKRKKDIEREILEEPDRIRGRYAVQTVRLEPAGIVYLWPEMG
jgi:hypothetical protein